MNAEEFRRLKTLFLELRAASPQRRQARLAAIAGSHPQRARRLQELLDENECDDVFLETPALGRDFELPEPAQLAREASEQAGLPEWIGGYRILEVLGVGGMGIVYRARQENPSREVALKVVQAGVASQAMLERLAFEAEVLARLQHAGIAAVLEAGTWDAGAGAQPYFAMEWVRGRDLLEFARTLDLTARLQLVRRIAAALEHAHQRGVIHRDLKPANILVTAEGNPKILDFGLAKLTEAGRGEGRAMPAIRTAHGIVVGTLAYMSPEQLAGQRSELDTRSDLYSLGVITYQLISGTLPYAVEGSSLAEFARTVAEQSPQSLGTVDPRSAGDLSTVVMKALEQDKERRYASVSAFADDLARFLRHEPVLARRASLAYQLRKFARRHRALVAGLAASLIALILGLAGTGWGWKNALTAQAKERAQRQRAATHMAEAQAARVSADRAAERARAVSDFLVGVLRRGDPLRGGVDPPLTEVLEDARNELATTFANQPVVEAELRQALGHTFLDLGRYETAAVEFRRALELSQTEHGRESTQALAAANGLGVALYESGRHVEAVTLLERTWQSSQELLRAHGQEALAVLANLGQALFVAGRLAESEAAVRLALEYLTAEFGLDHPDSVRALAQLARVVESRGRLPEAESLYHRAIDAGVVALGREHPVVLGVFDSLGCLLVSIGEESEGERLLIDTWRKRGTVLGSEHPDTLYSMNNLAWALSEMGRHAEAAALGGYALEVRERVLGPFHPRTLISRNNWAEQLALSGELERATEVFRCTLQDADQVLAADHWYRGAFLGNYGRVLASGGRLEQAEETLLASHAILERQLGIEHSRTRFVARGLGVVYESMGEHEAADLWRQAAQAAPGLSGAEWQSSGRWVAGAQ